MEPGEYTNRLLLIVTGLTPQVVTETLYALQQSDPAFIPSKVYVLTTGEGAQRIKLTLLSESPGWFFQYCKDYELANGVFQESNIYIISSANGQHINDVRSLEENKEMANSITDVVRQLTEKENSALHVSIAGGRKTMGFYAGYALSLFGRDQDRLSHVLVSAPYESHPDFFYPTIKSRVIYALDNTKKPLDCKDAIVTLAEIPFVKLRNGLPKKLLTGEVGFSEAVDSIQQNFKIEQLTFDINTVRIGESEIHLPPADLAFFSWFAERRKKRLSFLSCPPDGVLDKSYAQEYLNHYYRIKGEMGDDERTTRRYKHGMGKDDFLERKSKLNSKLRSMLGYKAKVYLISDNGQRPKRFGLELEPDKIDLTYLKENS